MEPAITGAGTLTKVTISSLALLKIVQHGTRALPDLCAGCLLGLDDGAGNLEVTDCFAYPAGGSDEDDDDGYGQGESDAAQFREDMLKLLRDCNVDDFCAGWYTTVDTGDWCNADLIEQQFEHQEDCDQGTGKAKSCLLVYDPHQSERGVLSLKAFRLTDAFMEVMRARSSPDPRLAQVADSALSRFKMTDIFYEIPIDVTDGSTLSTLALMDLTVGRSSNHQAFDTSDIGLERLVLSTDPLLEKNVSFAIEELDVLQEEQQKAAQFQKTLQKQKQNQDAWLEQRRKENALRQERGEELLPMVDPSNPIFKVLRDSTKLSSLLIRKQVDIYCEQINDWSAQSFEKLFLLGAVQQQQSLASSTSL